VRSKISQKTQIPQKGDEVFQTGRDIGWKAKRRHMQKINPMQSEHHAWDR